MDITVQANQAPFSGHLAVTPQDAKIQNATVESSDTGVVSIASNPDGTFTVTVVGVGEATVTANTQSASGKPLPPATAQITVTPIEATSIEIVFDVVV